LGFRRPSKVSKGLVETQASNLRLAGTPVYLCGT
jgi:hypothetical protein